MCLVLRKYEEDEIGGWKLRSLIGVKDQHELVNYENHLEDLYNKYLLGFLR